MNQAFLFAFQLLNALPQFIQAGIEISGLVTRMSERMHDMSLTGRDPTKEEWDELNAELEALRNELHAP